MTKEEFREKAGNLIDDYQFGIFGKLFDYDDFGEEMRVALVRGGVDSSEADMPLVEFLDDLYEQIKDSLTPTHKVGKWIRHYCNNGNLHHIECSNCHDWHENFLEHKYCPNCGAEMKCTGYKKNTPTPNPPRFLENECTNPNQ